MKKGKRALSLILAVALVMVSFFCNVDAQAKKKKKKEKVKISSVKFEKVSKKVRVQKGKKLRVKATVKATPKQEQI